MKFTIVTPTFNRTTYLNQTIRSIVYQEGDFDLEYIIQDGGSSEELLDILREWDCFINSKNFKPLCRSLKFSFSSEKDNGMYDAINKGFAKSAGDVMSWLNSDDLLHPYALQTLSTVFNLFPEVEWVTGIPNSYNTEGSRVGFDQQPSAYSKQFIQKGFYDIKFGKYGFNWIQQESCFWKRSLWEKSGAKLRTDKKYAADFYLWQGFADHAELHLIKSFLGGYRSHQDQITANPELYRKELQNFRPPPTSLKFLKVIFKFISKSKSLCKLKLHSKLFILFFQNKNAFQGPVIFWSFNKSKWIKTFRNIF